ncbi:MAG: hypothetical protein H7A25_05305 [Leptospiraceae bacterium]|nr:hypothetical protein [Leptospiraceae bacterium]MCP5499297.1 hypothetical protein [Leptospiraceae bacterium]
MKYFFLIALLFIGIFSSLYADCSVTIPSFDKPIQLKKGWLFKKGDNQEYKNVQLASTGGWENRLLPDIKIVSDTKIFGYSWYRCQLQLGPDAIKGKDFLGISLGKLRDVDEVYLNGTLIAQTGKLLPGLVPNQELRRVYYLPANLFHSGNNLIAIRLYSSTNYQGIAVVPEISNIMSLVWSRGKHDVVKIMFGFVFIMMGLYFILASTVKSSNRLSNLFFSLFSIFLGFYILFRSNYRFVLVNDFVYTMKFELLSLIPLPLLFAYFLTFYLQKERKIYFLAYEIPVLILFLFAMYSHEPSHWDLIIKYNIYLMLLPLIYLIYLIYTNYSGQKTRLKYLLIGILAIIPAALIDALNALNLTHLPESLHFGFMFFLIIISIQLSEEAVESYNNFIKLEKELMKMERLKTNFLMNISSEFRSYSEMVLKNISILSKSEEWKEELGKHAYLNNEAIQLMIKDAVFLDKLESKLYIPKPERFSLKDSIEELCKQLDKRLEQNRQNITLNIESGDIIVFQSKELLMTAIFHILDNYYKYTSEDTSMRIDTKQNTDTLEMKITDKGPGVDLEDPESLFDKFVRGNTKVIKEIPGTGIGLSIARESIRYMKGEMKLISKKGKGLSFEIQFPNKK